MLKSIYRFCKTLICPFNPIFYNSSYRILMDPMALHSLLSRLEASNKKSSRLERRVRIGSHLVLQNVATKEQVHLQIVKDKNIDPMMKDLLYTSVLGCELLGLRRGEVVVVKSSNGVAKWKIITINNEG